MKTKKKRTLLVALLLAPILYLALNMKAETESTEHEHSDAKSCEACALPSGAKKTEGTAVVKTEEEWKKQLTETQYHVLREHGTERAFQNEFWDNKKEGQYLCAGCDTHLFDSETKYKSGTGWPSYYTPAHKENVGETVDDSLWMTRTEVHCNVCGGHLGHVFTDGPKPTGLRYCINSASLTFKESKKK